MPLATRRSGATHTPPASAAPSSTEPSQLVVPLPTMASDLSLIALDDPSRRLTLLDLDEESPPPRRPLTPYRDEPDLHPVGEGADTPIRRVQSTSTVVSVSAPASDAQADRTAVASRTDESQVEPREGLDEAFLIKLGDGSSVVFRPAAPTSFNSPTITTRQPKPIRPPSQLQQQVHSLLKHSITVTARDTLQAASSSTSTLTHHSSLSSPVPPLNPSRPGSASSSDLARDPSTFSPLPTPDPWDTAPSSIDQSLETVEGTIISDRAIVPHTAAELAGLFDWHVTPLPFPKLDYPVCVKAGPKYKKSAKKGKDGAVAVVVAAQKQQQEEESVSPGKRKRENGEEDIEGRLGKVLVKYGAAAPSTPVPALTALRPRAITFTETPSIYTPSDVDVESQIDSDLDNTDSSDVGIEDLLDLDEEEQTDLLGPIYADEYHDNDDNAGEYEQPYRDLEETESLLDLDHLYLGGSDVMSSRGRGARQTAVRGRNNQYTAESHRVSISL